MDSIMFVYKIENAINGKVYIGITTRKYTRRFSEHKNNLNKNRHRNKHLQSSWNYYGSTAFNFKMLMQCYDKKELLKKEEYFIKLYNSNNSVNGYNKSSGGEYPVFSEESRKKISIANKGKILSKKHIAIIKKIHTGKVLSEHTRKLISEKNKGKRNSIKTEFKKGQEPLNRKKVIDLDSGIIYESTKAAGIALGYSRRMISLICSYNQKNSKNLKLEFVSTSERNF